MRSTILALFVLSLAACRPEVESTVPCTQNGDLSCPTGWRCGDEGTCVDGEAAPRVVFQQLSAEAVVSGSVPVSFRASSALGIVGGKLQLARSGARVDIPVTAEIAEDALTAVFSAQLDTTAFPDGAGELVATVDAVAGADGTASLAITILNNP